MRALSAQCGHVKRRLSRNEPLKGKVLEFALSVVEGDGGFPNDEVLRGIADKLSVGKTLSDYEYHIMVDVLLLHVRLGAA